VKSTISPLATLFAATLLLPVGLGAKGGCGNNDDIPIGGDTGGGGGGGEAGTCSVDDCGPPLGMPIYECPDGTIAGPTGNCVATPAGCGWEVISCPPGDPCAEADCGPALGMPNYICDDGSVGGPTGNCITDPATDTCAWEVRECPPPRGYQWFTTCGDPVCGGASDDPAIAPCDTEQEGQPCSTPGALCELEGDSCGLMLLCGDTDPKDEGCPVSRGRHKDTIRYLADRDLERVRDELLSMRLATWHYNSEPAATREHLGFIIDDHPQSPAVMSNGERVDLYGYTSMAAATIQLQQKQIDKLEREMAALRETVARDCRSK
jgi:hypothetical protein